MDGEESEGESSAEKLRRYLAERGATGLCIDETIRSIATGQVQVLVDHSDDDWLRLNFDEGDYEEFVSLIDESEDDEFIEDEYSTDCCRSLMIQHAILKLAELLDELGQEDPSLQDDLAKALRL
jgi:hypothetical protein